MPDLFDYAMNERMKNEAPLAARMRPRTLDEYIGQEHIVGEGDFGVNVPVPGLGSSTYCLPKSESNLLSCKA